VATHDHAHSHSHAHGQDAGDGHEEFSELSEIQLRVRALESILTEKGYVDSLAIDRIVQAYETKIGPHNGARIVAHAWADPAFRQRLLENANQAIAEVVDVDTLESDLKVVENTDQIHNMIVCTLCSCYPWEVLGLPPTWYKAAPYRSRAVLEPRVVLEEFGVRLPEDREIRVWDSNAEQRFIVLPQRPAGTDGWTVEQLEALVTRDSLIGTGLARQPDHVAAEVSR
jgi:nitrile hydratase